MESTNLKKAREIINNELSNCLKELGTDWYSKLCIIRGDLDVLISIVENPIKHEKLKKMFE